MKELRKIYLNNTDYLVNVRTRIVSKRSNGVTVYCGGDESTKVLKAVESRIRAQSAKSGRDAALRSCGLVRVVGALGGVYWE